MTGMEEVNRKWFLPAATNTRSGNKKRNLQVASLRWTKTGISLQRVFKQGNSLPQDITEAEGLHVCKKVSGYSCERKIQILLGPLAQESALKQYHYYTYRVLFLFPKHSVLDLVSFIRCTSAPTPHIHL